MSAGKTIAELLIKIGVSVDGAKEAERDVSKVTKSTETAGKTGGSKLTEFASSAKAAFSAVSVAAAGIATAVIAAGAAVLSFVDETTQGMDAIAKGAVKMGLTADEYQRLTQAAAHLDVSTEDLGAGIRKLNADLLAASLDGGAAFNQKLAAIGLSVADIEGKSATEQLGIIGDALAQVDDAARRSAISATIFGEDAGPKLATVLQAGSKGLAELSANAKGLFSDEDLAQAEAFQDAMTDVRLTLAGVKGDIAGELAPAIRSMVEGVTEWTEANREGLDAVVSFLTSALQPLVAGLKVALVPLELMVETSLAFYEALEFVRTSLAELGSEAIDAASKWEWVESIGSEFDKVAESVRGAVTAVQEFLLSWAPIRQLALDLGLISGTSSGLSSIGAVQNRIAAKNAIEAEAEAKAAAERERVQKARYEGGQSAATAAARRELGDALIQQFSGTKLTAADRQRIAMELGGESGRVIAAIDASAPKVKQASTSRGAASEEKVEARFGDYRDVLMTYQGKAPDEQMRALEMLEKGVMPKDHKPETSITITNNITNNVDASISVNGAGSPIDVGKAVRTAIMDMTKQAAAATPSTLVR